MASALLLAACGKNTFSTAAGAADRADHAAEAAGVADQNARRSLSNDAALEDKMRQLEEKVDDLESEVRTLRSQVSY